MKKINKNNIFKGFKSALSCICFLSILVLLIIRSYDILSWKDIMADYLSPVNQLNATKEDSIDVVFMGSSHTYCSIAPSVLWNQTGIASFNMTTSGQDKDSTYHYLVELLKTQSPEIVFVELWGLTFDYQMFEGNEHRNMMGMPLSENSLALIDDYMKNEERNMAYKLRWPVIHTRYKELDLYDFVNYELNEYGREADLHYESTFAHHPVESLEVMTPDELTETNRAWIESLYQLSLDEDFEIIFFIAPTVISTVEQAQINAVAQFADEHDVPFFDCNRLAEDIGLDYHTDFLDHYHLNGYGATKLTKYFGKFLTKNYDLNDYRGNEDYKQWDDSYTRYVQVKDTFELKQCETFDLYIQKLFEMDYIKCIVSFEGTYKQTISPRYIAWMLGLSDEDFEKGGTFIIENGKVTHIMDNTSTDVYLEELTKYSTLKIQNMNLVDPSATNNQDIMVNMDVVGTHHNGVNFVIYDTFRNEVVDIRGFE